MALMFQTILKSVAAVTADRHDKLVAVLAENNKDGSCERRGGGGGEGES